MSYKKTLLSCVFTLVFVICSFVFGNYVIPGFSLYLPDVKEATVAFADNNGIYGVDDLYIEVDDNRNYFDWDYGGTMSPLKKDQTVLVSGEIAFIDEITGEGANIDLIVEPKWKAYGMLVLFLLSVAGMLFFAGKTIIGFRKREWSKAERSATRDAISVWTIIICMLVFVVSIPYVMNGVQNLIEITHYNNHMSGEIMRANRMKYGEKEVRNYSTASKHYSLVNNRVRKIGLYNVATHVQLENAKEYDITISGTSSQVVWYREGANVFVFYNDNTQEDTYVLTYTEVVVELFCVFLMISSFLLIHIMVKRWFLEEKTEELKEAI